MENEKVTNEIAKKIKELRDMYYKAYPNGDYLAIAIYKDAILFNNRNWADDSAFPISYIESEETDDDNESL